MTGNSIRRLLGSLAAALLLTSTTSAVVIQRGYEMAEEFDAYYVWLGIGPEERPAHRYRLLGIRLCEPNPEVIESAADRQMAHLRTFQQGEKLN
jgi:hypothetical protein